MTAAKGRGRGGNHQHYMLQGVKADAERKAAQRRRGLLLATFKPRAEARQQEAGSEWV